MMNFYLHVSCCEHDVAFLIQFNSRSFTQNHSLSLMHSVQKLDHLQFLRRGFSALGSVIQSWPDKSYGSVLIVCQHGFMYYNFTFSIVCVCVFVCVTSTPLVSGVCARSFQVREAVREVLVVALFGLIDHLILWTKTKQHAHSHCYKRHS